MEYTNDLERILDSDRVLYRFITGSTAYGTAINNVSDIDTSGVFITDPKCMFGMHQGYSDYVHDARQDNRLYELKKWVHSLLASAPSMLESLFIPEDKILFKNPIIEPFFENRNMFLTKACYNPFYGFMRSQVEKCRGLNKKITNPMLERKEVLDFCYVPYKEGSTKVENWLDYRGMKQEYCGLNNIDNMVMTHALFYDWGRHFKEEKLFDYTIFNAWCDRQELTSEVTDLFKEGKISEEEYKKRYKNAQLAQMYEYICKTYGLLMGDENMFIEWYEYQCSHIKDYKGIVVKDNQNDIKLSSIAKHDIRLTVMCFNINAYSQHCRQYLEWQTWNKEKNQARYESNLDKSYDAKNIAHCFRVMEMCKEILEGKGLIVDRRVAGDAEFLKEIRNHKFEYEEIMTMLEIKKAEINKAYENTTLPEKIDYDAVNDMLIEIQKEWIRKKHFM